MTCTTKEYYGLYYSKDYFMLKLYPVVADNTPEFGFYVFKTGDDNADDESINSSFRRTSNVMR